MTLCHQAMHYVNGIITMLYVCYVFGTVLYGMDGVSILSCMYTMKKNYEWMIHTISAVPGWAVAVAV